MTTLIFLATAIALLILLVRLITKLIQHKSSISSIRTIAILLIGYIVIWTCFYFLSTYKPIPLGTDVCFDDWCATITSIEHPDSLGKGNQTVYPQGQFVILHIKMSNHARGIAQKPSEPRIHIIDENGRSWSFSEAGQQALETQTGKQISFDSRLELHQSLETQLVFDIPVNAKQLKAFIEEGPNITKLLFRENEEVFLIQ